MVRYIAQRFIGMIVVMLLVVTIVFLIVRVAPGDPASVMLGPEATAASRRCCRNLAATIVLDWAARASGDHFERLETRFGNSFI